MSEFRADFPFFDHLPESVYLDNAATTQKPAQVLQALQTYYKEQNANVHRGVHKLSVIATEVFEESRLKVAKFINAPSREEVIWTRGTTEGINLVASSIGSSVLDSDSHVIISEMEHHSNIVPWQIVCNQTGAKLLAVHVNSDGELDLDHFKELLSDQTKIVALAHVSNALGSVNPVQELTRLAHEVGALVVVDGAQATAHLSMDVQAIDCDFYAFSGHKMFGPTGIGALYARKEIMTEAPPWQGGGEMIEEVFLDHSTYQGLPYRFEAGTPNIAGAVGMGAAVDYLHSLDSTAVEVHELDLLIYASSRLKQIEGVEIIGEATNKAPVISFNLKDAHHSDVGTLLDNQGVGVRTGHHCAMPLMRSLGISGTVRASFALYNSRNDIDKLVAGVEKARQMLVA